MQVEFLGTSTSPLPSRNYSSLLVRLGPEAVMVDCGEGTQRQLFQHFPRARLAQIRVVLITHLHPDHVLGLAPMIFSMMGPSAPAMEPGKPRIEIYGPLGLRALIRTTMAVCYASLSSDFVVHELLWPTQPEYPHIPCDSSFTFSEADDVTIPKHVRGQQRVLPLLPPHANELQGRNIRMDPKTHTWANFLRVGNSDISVSAAPITHRCPTVGYVFKEPASASQSISAQDLAILDSNTEALFAQRGVKNPRTLLRRLLREREPLHLPDGNVLQPPRLDRPGRKLCILGDTSDATASLETGGMLALAKDADLVVHECTYAYLTDKALKMAREAHADLAPSLAASLLLPDEADERAFSRGHSVPRNVGSFAAHIGARRILLNHFSARVPAPRVVGCDPLRSENQLRQDAKTTESQNRYFVLREIERQVEESWRTNLASPQITKLQVVAAYDGLVVPVEPRTPLDTEQRSIQ